MTNKVLVQLDCATHAMMWEGCSNALRCISASGIPYGGPPDRPWAGPHFTIKAALIEWITNGNFDGAGIGTFVVDASGVARARPNVSRLRHAGTTTVSALPRRSTRMPARRATAATCAASSGSDRVVARARARRPLCALLK
jgi:hypothetical protein